jgi:hypothetical protein
MAKRDSEAAVEKGYGNGDGKEIPFDDSIDTVSESRR